MRTAEVDVRRMDHGSVLEALAGLTLAPEPQDASEAPRAVPSSAFLPARRPPVEPGTGIIDVRALAIRPRRREVTRPVPAAAAARSVPTVVVSPSLTREPPLPAPPAPTTAPAGRLSPLLAFMIGALVGTGVFAASLLVQAAT